MKVAWLADDPGYVGGAELTQQEFLDAAPDSVEVVRIGPSSIGYVRECDAVVMHNTATYPRSTIEAIRYVPRKVRFWHDMGGNGDMDLEKFQMETCRNVFCSGLQRSIWPHHVGPRETWIIPPPVDVNRFRPPRHVRRHPERSGTCWIGQMRGTGKGVHLAVEWAEKHREHVTFFGEGEFAPAESEFVSVAGPLAPSDVPQTLWNFERFLFLPVQVEPFARTVFEAHIAGCDVVTNRLVGAREYLDEPERVENATKDFWDVVLG